MARIKPEIKMTRFILAALALSVATLSAASGQQRIGFIDSQALRQRLPAFQEIQSELERLQLSFQQEARDRENKLQAKQEAYTKQELLMSEASRTAKQQEMEAEFRELQQYAQDKLGPEGELFRQNLDRSSPIYKRVNEILKTMAEEEGYDFILDAAVGGVIVFADPKHDLTEQLIAKLMEPVPETEVIAE